jgi:uncharacterized membrane protein (UPF0127 family)
VIESIGWGPKTATLPLALTAQRLTGTGERSAAGALRCSMEELTVSARLRRLPRSTVLGSEVPVARGLRGRLLGLALLDRDRAGAGLLIPRCSSVHTFGMRFPLDLVFLDETGAVEIHLRVHPRRIVSCPRAAAVLEFPSPERRQGS